MTPRPVDAGSFAEAVYNLVQPLAWDDPNRGWALLLYLGAMGQMFQDLDSYAHDGPHGEPGWSILLDINRMPDAAVPWFGQFVGVIVDTALPVAQQRQQIRDHLGWGRGTPKALKDAIVKYLTGTQNVQIRERDTGAYHFTVITYASETPGIVNWTYQDFYNNYLTYQAMYFDWDSYYLIWLQGSGVDNRIGAILAKGKPAGLVMDYRVLSAEDYYNLYTEWPTYQSIYDSPLFPTYTGIYNYLSPGVPMTFEAVISALSYQDLWNREQTYQDIYDEFLTY